MKVFVAGATGAIGRYLLPRLIREGHEVTAMTRVPARAEQIRALGATAVVCDVFDRDQLHRVLDDAQPEIVIHQLTSLPPRIDPRRASQSLAHTNRLRSEGTRLLMDAAIAAGARRFVAQSIATYYAPTSTTPATEDEPLYTHAPAAFASIVHAIEDLERITLQTPGIEGIVLRYGYFYGPGTVYAADGTLAEDVRRRRIPIIGHGGGVFSFVHIDDAAAATVLALDRGEPGAYNIVDHEPAPLREWLPVFAELLGAPPPMRLPALIGRLAAGRFGLYWATEQRGASNRKAQQRLGWQPALASWRQGFRSELASPPQRVVGSRQWAGSQ